MPQKYPSYVGEYRQQMIELVRRGRTPTELVGSSSAPLGRFATGYGKRVGAAVVRRENDGGPDGKLVCCTLA